MNLSFQNPNFLQGDLFFGKTQIQTQKNPTFDFDVPSWKPLKVLSKVNSLMCKIQVTLQVMSLFENCNLIKAVQRDILHSLKKQGSFERQNCTYHSGNLHIVENGCCLFILYSGVINAAMSNKNSRLQCCHSWLSITQLQKQLNKNVIVVSKCTIYLQKAKISFFCTQKVGPEQIEKFLQSLFCYQIQTLDT